MLLPLLLAAAAHAQPTPDQLDFFTPLLETAPPRITRTADRLAVAYLSEPGGLDWLVEAGRSHAVVLIGEDHWQARTVALERQMVELLVAEAGYRQLVFETAYSVTPLLQAYTRIADDEEAAAFAAEHLAGPLLTLERVALLDGIRQHNQSHPDDPVAVLALDLEHIAYLEELGAEAFRSQLEERLAALPEDLLTAEERETFLAQAEANRAGTVAYYAAEDAAEADPPSGEGGEAIRQARIEANLTGLFGLASKAVLVGGAWHFELGPACEQGHRGEGCFLAQRHAATRGQVFNLRIVSLGRYHSSWMTAEAKEACRGTLVEYTGLFQQWEVWEKLFSEHGEALYDNFPPRTRLDTAAMWHGLQRPGEAYRLDLEASSLRVSRTKGHLPRPVVDTYAEVVVWPFDTSSQPYCAVAGPGGVGESE